MIDLKDIKTQIESTKPLILNITNLVTMDFIANTLLALGASPVMSNDISDALELSKIASGISINIGTLDNHFCQLSLAIAKTNNKNKPLVLDPVGSGVSTIRTNTSLQLLPYSTIIKGNASEIQSLYQNSGNTKGVDSSIDTYEALPQAKLISQKYDITVSISGKTDYIIYNNLCFSCPFGHPYMSQITGMGCVLSSIIAVFNSIEPDSTKASYYAHLYYSLCGELAYQKSQSLGLFKNYFIDYLHNPDYDYMTNRINSL